EPALVDVRQIDQNPKLVAPANQFLPEVGQTWSRVRRRWTPKGHTVAKGIRPAPNRPQRTQPGGTQYLQQLELRIDGFGAFEVKDSSQNAFVLALLDIADAAADTNAPL